jgi:hypothetical protein
MNRTYFLLVAGLMCHAELVAQGQPAGTAWQSFGGRGVAAQPLPRQEAGKPFSATATTQTTQTLADGTHVSQTTTVVQYRDAEGRVRTETTQPGGPSSGPTKVITIRDPVANVTYRLDPANKSATKLPMAGAAAGGRGGIVQATAQPSYDAVVAAQAAGGRGRGASGDSAGRAPEAQTAYQATYEQLAAGRGGRRGGSGDTPARITIQPGQAVVLPPADNSNDIVDDLGTLTVNGVAARGTRVTTVVKVGAIGNDREFRSVSERWFSSDLNLLVKSVNTDPRFGTTTYELTNISRQPPDSSLFQVPADYTIVGR